MTPKQAAEIIGCTVGHCRHLIRTGKLEATRKPTSSGYEYEVSREEANRLRDVESNVGWKRGKERYQPPT